MSSLVQPIIWLKDVKGVSWNVPALPSLRFKCSVYARRLWELRVRRCPRPRHREWCKVRAWPLREGMATMSKALSWPKAMGSQPAAFIVHVIVEEFMEGRCTNFTPTDCGNVWIMCDEHQAGDTGGKYSTPVLWDKKLSTIVTWLILWTCVLDFARKEASTCGPPHSCASLGYSSSLPRWTTNRWTSCAPKQKTELLRLRSKHFRTELKPVASSDCVSSGLESIALQTALVIHMDRMDTCILTIQFLRHVQQQVQQMGQKAWDLLAWVMSLHSLSCCSRICLSHEQILRSP